jgi:hypothetical protein
MPLLISIIFSNYITCYTSLKIPLETVPALRFFESTAKKRENNLSIKTVKNLYTGEHHIVWHKTVLSI